MSSIRKFSDVLEVTEEALWEEGAFNAFVDIDARFHIDPHLLQKTKIPEFANSYERITAYFENVLRLLRGSKKPGDALFRLLYRTPKFVQVAQTNERQPEYLNHASSNTSPSPTPSETGFYQFDGYGQ